MYADGQTGHIGNQYQPAVGMRLVCIVFPLQDKPEYDGRKGRRIGIYLSLDGREPECVTESINQCTDEPGPLDGDGLCKRRCVTVTDNQSA